MEQAELIEQRPLPVADDEVDILDLLIVLAKRKRLILTITAASAMLALIVSLILPNRYTATTKILPPQQSQSASSMLMAQLAGGGMGPLAALAGSGLGLKNPNDIYIGILKSRTVEDALIARFDLRRIYSDKRQSDARKDLEKASEITAEKEGLISVSVEDKDAKRSADIANAYVNELRNLTQHLAVTEASQRRLFFEQQVQEARDDLSRAEVALKETQQKTGMIQLDSQAKAIIEAVGHLRAQIAAKEVQLQAMRSFATQQNPDTVLAQQELAGLRVQLDKLEAQQVGGNGDPLVSTGKVPGVALEYVRKLRDVKYYEAIFELLAKQYEAAKIDESREAAVIQVLDQALEPDHKSSPHRLIIVMLCAICALVAACLSLLIAEAVSRLQLDPGRATQLSRLRGLLRGKDKRGMVISKHGG
jgi:capsule polysaccharide export protein KpsE/RkpR